MKAEETENYVIKVKTSGISRRCYLIKAIFILCLATLLAVLILMVFLTPLSLSAFVGDARDEFKIDGAKPGVMKTGWDSVPEPVSS